MGVIQRVGPTTIVRIAHGPNRQAAIGHVRGRIRQDVVVDQVEIALAPRQRPGQGVVAEHGRVLCLGGGPDVADRIVKGRVDVRPAARQHVAQPGHVAMKMRREVPKQLAGSAGAGYEDRHSPNVLIVDQPFLLGKRQAGAINAERFGQHQGRAVLMRGRGRVLGEMVVRFAGEQLPLDNVDSPARPCSAAAAARAPAPRL